MGQIIILHEDGTTEEIDRNDEPTAEELHRWVGGYFEVVFCRWQGKRTYMFLDEDGKNKGRVINPAATAIAEIDPRDYIVGTAVVVVDIEMT